jgi:hypothetical protein
VRVAKDPITGPDDGRRIPLDEDTEGIPVATEDGLDRDAGDRVVRCRGCGNARAA